MAVEHIRLSQQAKVQLVKLKRVTGITHWNVLCRWALAISLAEQSTPSTAKIPADSNVEMSWRVFGGRYADLYMAAPQGALHPGRTQHRSGDTCLAVPLAPASRYFLPGRQQGIARDRRPHFDGPADGVKMHASDCRPPQNSNLAHGTFAPDQTGSCRRHSEAGAIGP